MPAKSNEDVLAGVRRALYRRVIAQVRASLRSATPDQLLEAVAEPTAAGTLARLVSAAPGIEAGAGADDWAAALLRGAAAKERLLQEAGGALSTGEVARLLGVTAAAVQQRRLRRTLLAVPLANGEWGYPACQFTSAGVARGLPRVLAAFGTDEPWVRLSVLLSRDPALGDARLIDLLAEDRSVDEVERIARGYGVQGAA